MSSSIDGQVPEEKPTGLTTSHRKEQRGRKRNNDLPPSRAREVQRAFRARRAQHLGVMEERLKEVEAENAQLREMLHMPPANRPVLRSGPTGRGKYIDAAGATSGITSGGSQSGKRSGGEGGDNDYDTDGGRSGRGQSIDARGDTDTPNIHGKRVAVNQLVRSDSDLRAGEVAYHANQSISPSSFSHQSQQPQQPLNNPNQFGFYTNANTNTYSPIPLPAIGIPSSSFSRNGQQNNLLYTPNGNQRDSPSAFGSLGEDEAANNNPNPNQFPSLYALFPQNSGSPSTTQPQQQQQNGNNFPNPSIMYPNLVSQPVSPSNNSNGPPSAGVVVDPTFAAFSNSPYPGSHGTDASTYRDPTPAATFSVMDRLRVSCRLDDDLVTSDPGLLAFCNDIVESTQCGPSGESGEGEEDAEIDSSLSDLPGSTSWFSIRQVWDLLKPHFTASLNFDQQNMDVKDAMQVGTSAADLVLRAAGANAARRGTIRYKKTEGIVVVGSVVGTLLVELNRGPQEHTNS